MRRRDGRGVFHSFVHWTDVYSASAADQVLDHAGYMQESEIDLAQVLKEDIIAQAQAWNFCKAYTDEAISEIYNVSKTISMVPGA